MALRPFVGNAGRELDLVLADAGIRRQDVNITNVVPYRPVGNDFKKHPEAQVKAGLRELYALIERLKPKLIVAMGNEACYSLIPNWPTGGRTIYGAKGINDRRGYFWETPYGWVLSTLHPATITRQAVPNRALITNDMLRARMWLRGELPRQKWPDPLYIPLTNSAQVSYLTDSEMLGADIETKWGTTELLCHGFCGDDMVPYVAKYGEGFQYMEELLVAPVIKVYHNGWGFDIPFLLYDYGMDLIVGYNHDTQNLWHALEPELAGKDAGGEDMKMEAKFTRKGLAFLATLAEPYAYNFEWWKDYPDPDDPNHNYLMYELNAKDAYVTRLFAGHLLAAVQRDGVLPQYHTTMDVGFGCMVMQKRGIPIHDELRRERMRRLIIRSKTLLAQASKAGLKYIEDNDLEFFKDHKRCECCMGGKVARQHCWKCAGFEKKPGKAELVAAGGDPKLKKEQLEELLLAPCSTCGGVGKIPSFHFNPTSWQQLQQLIYTELQAPKHTWKGKTTTNEQAMMKVLRWAGGKFGVEE